MSISVLFILNVVFMWNHPTDIKLDLIHLCFEIVVKYDIKLIETFILRIKN